MCIRDRAKWMRLRYNCNLVEALRLMLPAGMRKGDVREKTRRVARLADPEATARGPRQQEILERLRAGDVEASLLPAAPLRALVEKGAVEIYARGERRAPAVLRGETLPDPPLTLSLIHIYLFPNMTVLKNLTLAPRKLKGMTQQAADEKAMALLARVGLADRADAYPNQDVYKRQIMKKHPTPS